MKGISCKELLNYIPDELLEDLEEKTKVNQQVKKLTGKIFFKLLLFSSLNTERISLRVMEEFWNSEKFKTFSGKNNQKVKHSGIGDRLGNIDSKFFQEIFKYLSYKFEKELNEKVKIGSKSFDLLKFDSTLVAISSNLIDFGMKGIAKNKSNKNQVKYTIGLKNFLPQDLKLFTEQSYTSEEVALREAILTSVDKQNSIVVFDRGLQRRKTFKDFSEKGILFVTRLKNRVRYQEVRENKKVQGRKSETLVLKKDLIVKLKDETEKFMSEKFRLIIGTSRETGEEFLFLSNITDLNARTITDIYYDRWSIEMFFRFIKQELNFKHLVSRSKNGIEVMLYMTMITAILLLVYKKRNKISGYKIAKLRFALELEMEIIKDIVFACDGDISLISKFEKRVPT